MSPEEILMSESQERMMAICEPDDIDAFMAICAKWEVQATVIGELIEGDRLLIDWHGERIVDVDPRTVAHEGPTYDRPAARPDWLDALNADHANALPRPQSGAELTADLLALVASPNLCDRSWVTDQYDRYVRGNSVLAQPENSGMLRIDERTGLGISLATDANGRYCLLNPYQGAQLALSEAYRNVSVSGAEPVAVTDCLNFGSPEDPEVMWQFIETIKGLVDGCRALGIPVTGGNVSFYNQTAGRNIMPTPQVGVLGVIDDVAQRTQMGFSTAGDLVLLLGTTKDELGGSAWAQVAHDHLGGLPPQPNFVAERGLAKVLQTASRLGLVRSAHDLSEGGLAIGLTESCLRNDLGVRVQLPAGLDVAATLFSESVARAVVSLDPEQLAEFSALCESQGVALTRLGEVSAEPELVVEGLFALPLTEIKDAWAAPIPAAMG